MTGADDQPLSRLVVRGGYVLALDGDLPMLRRADVVVDGNTITAIVDGGLDELVGDPEVLEVTGSCILPGLVDLHFHTALGKGRFDDLPLDRWIEAWWYPILRAMDPEIAYWAGMLAYSDGSRVPATVLSLRSTQASGASLRVR